MHTMWGAITEVVGTTLTIAVLTALIAGPPEMIARRRKRRQEQLLRERRKQRADAWWAGQ